MAPVICVALLRLDGRGVLQHVAHVMRKQRVISICRDPSRALFTALRRLRQVHVVLRLPPRRRVVRPAALKSRWM